MTFLYFDFITTTKHIYLKFVLERLLLQKIIIYS